MKKIVLISFCVVLACANAICQTNDSWKKWDWLIGEWIGEGSGQPGTGEGSFSFKPELGSKILYRKNISSYPETQQRPAFTHEDLMIVYPEGSKAIYFDNEGHVINYTVTFGEREIVFLSEKTQGIPAFRLIYNSLNTGVGIKFEISQDGSTFKTYLEGKARRK